MKPHLLLTLLAAALLGLVLPLAASARVDSAGGLPMGSTIVQEADDDADEAEAEDADDEQGEDDELENEGTIALGTDSVLVTDEQGGVTSCAVPAGVDLSAFAGQKVELKCRLVNGVWTVARVKSEDGKTEIRIAGVDHSGPGKFGTGEDNSGPGNAEDDDEDNSGPGHLDDDDDDNSGPGHVDDASDDDSTSLDDDDDDHSGPGGGGDDDEEDDD